MSKLILFDTNILVHLVRESRLGAHVRQTYRPLLADPRPLISVVTEGELRSLINQWKWAMEMGEAQDQPSTLSGAVFFAGSGRSGRRIRGLRGA